MPRLFLAAHVATFVLLERLPLQVSLRNSASRLLARTAWERRDVRQYDLLRENGGPVKALRELGRGFVVVLGTVAALVVLWLCPMLLPERWQYYFYSPASSLLLFLALLVSPFVTCHVLRRWILGQPRR